MGQSPEDFDSASVEEDQVMAGSVPAGTGLMEGWQRTVCGKARSCGSLGETRHSGSLVSCTPG